MAPGPRRVAVLAVLTTTALAAGVAQAHPFGDPQTAQISNDGDTVHVRWRAAPDDLSALAIELRVVESGRTFVYDDGALVPEEKAPVDLMAAAASEDVPAGEPAVLTATLSETASGEVYFASRGTTLCVATVSAGTAICTADGLRAGPYSVVATYGGDTNHATDQARFVFRVAR